MKKAANKQDNQFNMQTADDIGGRALDLDEAALLADLLDGDGEIIEEDDDLFHDGAIHAGVADIEKADASHKEHDEEPAATPEVKTSKKKAKGEKKTKEAKVADKPKEPRMPAHAKKSEKVSFVLGEKKSEFLVLEMDDALLDAEALQAKQDEVLAEIDKLAIKVGEKAVMLFGWLTKGGSLNEVMRRTFAVLIKDGELTSGDKGNLQTDLLGKPYSLGTARSQSNQMFMLMPALKVTIKEKGRMVLNPNSTIMMKAKAELGL
jgi:hypothetical protein